MSDGWDEMREAVKDLKAFMVAADDQASALTDRELGEQILSGRWTTIEIQEAARRLSARSS